MDRLFACPGSAILPRGVDVEGIAASWGTKVHDWVETGIYPEGSDGKEIAKRVIKSGLKREEFWPGGEHEVALAYNLVTGEARRYVAPRPLPPGNSLKAHKSAWKDAFDNEWVTGTLDWVKDILDTYWVDDVKTGRNAHWKQAEAQQSCYALMYSVYRYGKIQAGRSTIAHWPKYPIARLPLRHGSSLSEDYLGTFLVKLQKLREEILAGRDLYKTGTINEAELCVGEHCRFCPSRTACPKINQ